jgi:hypothetical protein
MINLTDNGVELWQKTKRLRPNSAPKRKRKL